MSKEVSGTWPQGSCPVNNWNLHVWFVLNSFYDNDSMNIGKTKQSEFVAW